MEAYFHISGERPQSCSAYDEFSDDTQFRNYVLLTIVDPSKIRPEILELNLHHFWPGTLIGKLLHLTNDEFLVKVVPWARMEDHIALRTVNIGCCTIKLRRRSMMEGYILEHRQCKVWIKMKTLHIYTWSFKNCIKLLKCLEIF